MRTRVMLAIYVIGAAVAVAKPSAGYAAGECDGDRRAITVFSGYGVGPAPGTKVYGCTTGAADTRYILPAANTISVQFSQDLKVSQLRSHVKGLGLDEDVPLKRNQPTAAG